MIELIDVWYRAGRHQILTGINLSIRSGDFMGICGPSGAGKSTLLRLIHMDIMPTRGKVQVTDYSSSTISQREIPYLRRKIGVIFQDFKLLEDRDVFENVAFALWATGVKRGRIKKRVFKILAEVGLSHKRYSGIQELSGGEQQRVAIARAMANEPLVLLADEPTGNLDRDTADGILQLLKRINQRGMAVVMASHQESIQEFSGKQVYLKEGKIVP
ncbi:cell division ATP-binding protein FtsE [bacterium I07]|nr:cell division ATP-binding protein FtsE [bacterium I07]